VKGVAAVTPKWLRRVTAGLLAVLIAGCGLSDYEGRMRAAQERVARFTDESEMLGPQVAIPTKLVVSTPAKDPQGKKDPKGAKDQKPPTPGTERRNVITYPFYLRLPRGIRPTPDPDARFDLVYRYPKSGNSGFAEVYLAFGTEPPTTFADRVARVFPRGAEPVVPSQKEVTVPGRQQALTFDVREFNDAQTAWSVCAHSEGNSTIAIVYRMDKAQKPALQNVVELSLSTLAMGTEAEQVMRSESDRKAAANRK